MLNLISYCSVAHSWATGQTRLFVTPWAIACQTSLSLTISQFVQVQVHCFVDTIQPSHLLTANSLEKTLMLGKIEDGRRGHQRPLTPSSSAFNFSQLRGFSNESSVCIR
ncbi:unnamed protein product [Rangifer tarandus platyrhynchus]|uniref:Uncharacterized protein n=2 Tax=Rangifer tarandus platyrhynchus TaxID=3082113 RepID=A0AC59YEC7_RANTA|nr:unnamed protein product [Rangifer tarandus platyrhynchus]